MKFVKNPCNNYFALWCAYLLQGTFYESGSLISQSLLLIILLISLVDVYRVNSFKNLPIYFKGLNALLALFTVYGILLLLTDGIYYKSFIGEPIFSLNYLRTLYYSILPVYSCYYYARRGYLNSKIFKIWVWVFVVVAIAEYFRIQREMLVILSERGSERSEITNNIGYMILLLTPCVFLFNRNTKIQFLIYGICVVFVVMSMKRGAILILFASTLLFINDKLKIVSKNRRFTYLLLFILGFFFLYQILADNLANSEYFHERLEETMSGNSSGRDRIYAFFWNHFLKGSDIIQMLFGNGAQGTVKIYHLHAHNDWLEILTNQGLFGIFIYVYYWVMFRRSCKERGKSAEAKLVLNYLFVILFLRTFFSMSIEDMNIYSSSMMGYALADGFKRDFGRINK